MDLVELQSNVYRLPPKKKQNKQTNKQTNKQKDKHDNCSFHVFVRLDCTPSKSTNSKKIYRITEYKIMKLVVRYIHNGLGCLGTEVPLSTKLALEFVRVPPPPRPGINPGLTRGILNSLFPICIIHESLSSSSQWAKEVMIREIGNL